MKYFDNGLGFTVTAERPDVERFSECWPCCDLPLKPIHFSFDDNGDLVDLTPMSVADCDGIGALADDCKAYGLNHPKQKRKNKTV